MLPKKKTAVLIANFNRKKNTYECILSLNVAKFKYDIYLLDDKSNDGSYNFLKKKFPDINIFKGNGNLYWARGTNLLWKKAAKKKYDFYFFLNNDVKLYRNFYIELFKTFLKKKNSIITGKLVSSKNHNKIIYGGFDISKKIITNPKITEVCHLSGNCFIVSKKIFNKLGFFDEAYHHHTADIDYGLRARRYGIKTFATKNIVGECLPNTINYARKNNTNLIRRFLFLFSPLGLNPIIYFYFLRKNYSLFNSIIRIIYLIVINIFPDFLYNKLELLKNKYIIKYYR